MSLLLIILQILGGSSMLVVGLVLITQPKSFPSTRALATGWLSRLSGFLASIAGIATLVAVHVPFLAFFSAAVNCILVACLWVGLTSRGGTHLWPVPFALLAVHLAIGAIQPLGLKVLLLPKADTLPYVPVPARTIKTYDAGQWFESVRAGADGTLYLSSNRGDNYATGDKSKAQGQVIARSPDGTERIVFTLPMGSTSGVFAIAPGGTLYLTGTGANTGIWRIPHQGEPTLLARLPRGAWPNGLDFGPDGMLYSADSALGLVWRIDPNTGRAQRAVEDPALAARHYIALAPGANGIHFRGREMLVTVSDRTRVLSFTLRPDGSFAAPKVIATGIPGDDFAIAPDGSLYVTTHPYNTVVRVGPDGTRSVIANARENIVGATDAVFGRTPQDADTLYVVTDGGAFQGGQSARGALIALKPFAH